MLMKEAQTDRCVLCHLAGPVVPRPRTVHVALCSLQPACLPFSFAPAITKFCRPRSRRPLFRITKGKKGWLTGARPSLSSLPFGRTECPPDHRAANILLLTGLFYYKSLSPDFNGCFGFSQEFLAVTCDLVRVQSFETCRCFTLFTRSVF